MDPLVKKLAEIVKKQQKQIQKLAQVSLGDAMEKAVQEKSNVAPGLKSAPDLGTDPQASGYVDIGKVEPRKQTPVVPHAMPKPDSMVRSLNGLMDTAKKIAEKNGSTKGKFNLACLKYVKSIQKADASGSNYMVKISAQELANAEKLRGKPLTPKEKDARIVKMLQALFSDMFPGQAVKFQYSY